VAELAGLERAAEVDAGLHVEHLQPGAQDDVDQPAADGAVDGVHPVLLGVAVGPREAAGQLEVLGGEDQRVEVGVAEHQPPARPQDPHGLGEERVGVGQAFEDVVAQHPVHARGGKRQPAGQVGMDEQRGPGGEPSCGLAQRGRAGIQGAGGCWQGRGDHLEGRPGPAAEVDDPVPWRGSHESSQPA